MQVPVNFYKFLLVNLHMSEKRCTFAAAKVLGSPMNANEARSVGRAEASRNIMNL